MDYDAKQIEKRRLEEEKRLKKFHKSLGLRGNYSKEDIAQAVLKFAKTCRGWFEICLTEEQKKDREFMLEMFKSNENFVNEYYIPQAFKNDSKFLLEFLKLYYDKEKNSSYRADKALKTYEYHKGLKYFELRKNPEFLNMFAREFPECNILQVIDMIADESVFSKNKKEFARLSSGLSKDVYISGARHFGSAFVVHVPKDNPYFMETLITGIENDGFDSLAFLPKEMVYENRSLIVLASKVSGFEGLKEHFLSNLSPRREHFYMCHGSPHTSHYTDYEYYPLRKALIEDDALFSQIALPEEDKAKLRAYVAKETKEFYDQIKTYEERGIVPSKKNQTPAVGSAKINPMFGERTSKEHDRRVGNVEDGVQTSKKDGK